MSTTRKPSYSVIQDDVRLPDHERLERGNARSLLTAARSNGGTCTTSLECERKAARRLVTAGIGAFDGRNVYIAPTR
jgi:hypothetical protein